jgi:FkbH-like protein
MHGYLAGLEMQAHWSPFSENGLGRIVQLINKTNQFNLTTPRVSEAEVRGWMADPCMKTWQVRLTDRFGDNGIVALMAARICAGECALTLLLMSCRVLGRRLEEELFNLLGAAAREAGAARITGVYRPTAKNGMVRDLLQRFGFEHTADNADGSTEWTLPASAFIPRQTEIAVKHNPL